jgi:hypothetical protein
MRHSKNGASGWNLKIDKIMGKKQLRQDARCLCQSCVEQDSKDRQTQIQEGAERLRKLIEHWCPENLLFEGMPNILARAFMQATACCADQKRVLDGSQPIRPLDSYPDPMKGFKNTPTGF